MLKLLERLEEATTGLQRRSDFRPPITAGFATMETGAKRYTTDSVQWQFELRLQLSARFWANNAQLSIAREAAQRALMRELFRDVLQQLPHIEHAVADGDQRQAFTLLGALRKSLEE